MNDIQILYPSHDGTNIHHCFLAEAEAMQQVGFIVGIKPLEFATLIIIRGFTINKAEHYPDENRIIQGWEEYKRTLYMSEYLWCISENTIPTELVHNITENVVSKISITKGWNKVFIKSDITSLFALGERTSVWPDTPLNQMAEEYAKRNIIGPFAVRQFIDNPEIFYDEQRYWVLNGNVYHPSGIIPDFVSEAAKKLFYFSGSRYFTIDVAGNYIVEVNPGESSDRGGDNPLDFFCEIFAKEFLS